MPVFNKADTGKKPGPKMTAVYGPLDPLALRLLASSNIDFYSLQTLSMAAASVNKEDKKNVDLAYGVLLEYFRGHENHYIPRVLAVLEKSEVASWKSVNAPPPTRSNVINQVYATFQHKTEAYKKTWIKCAAFYLHQGLITPPVRMPASWTPVLDPDQLTVLLPLPSGYKYFKYDYRFDVDLFQLIRKQGYNLDSLEDFLQSESELKVNEGGFFAALFKISDEEFYIKLSLLKLIMQEKQRIPRILGQKNTFINNDTYNLLLMVGLPSLGPEDILYYLRTDYLSLPDSLQQVIGYMLETILIWYLNANVIAYKKTATQRLDIQTLYYDENFYVNPVSRHDYLMETSSEYKKIEKEKMLERSKTKALPDPEEPAEPEEEDDPMASAAAPGRTTASNFLPGVEPTIHDSLNEWDVYKSWQEHSGTKEEITLDAVARRQAAGLGMQTGIYYLQQWLFRRFGIDALAGGFHPYWMAIGSYLMAYDVVPGTTGDSLARLYTRLDFYKPEWTKLLNKVNLKWWLGNPVELRKAIDLNSPGFLAKLEKEGFNVPALLQYFGEAQRIKYIPSTKAPPLDPAEKTRPVTAQSGTSRNPPGKPIFYSPFDPPPFEDVQGWRSDDYIGPGLGDFIAYPATVTYTGGLPARQKKPSEIDPREGKHAPEEKQEIDAEGNPVPPGKPQKPGEQKQGETGIALALGGAGLLMALAIASSGSRKRKGE